MPTLPNSVSHYYGSDLDNIVKITKITFEKYYSTSAYLYFSGEKVYNDDNVSDKCWVGIKIYDSENNVVVTNTYMSPALLTGEKFSGDKWHITYAFAYGKIYRLELLDVV